MARIVIAAALGLAVAAAPVSAQPQHGSGNRPVMLKADDGLDPCSLGEITGAGDGAIMVFPGDSTDLEWVDTLSDGDPVWLCDGDKDSDMVGIVYSADREADCGVGSPVDKDIRYAGPCQSGWIRAEWVRVIAG